RRTTRTRRPRPQMMPSRTAGRRHRLRPPAVRRPVPTTHLGVGAIRTSKALSIPGAAKNNPADLPRLPAGAGKTATVEATIRAAAVALAGEIDASSAAG